MALNEIFVKNINYSGTGHGDKLGDGGRIHLLVTTTRKYWQLAYRYLGKQKMLALGGDPTVSLKSARDVRTAAKERLARCIDPSAAKREAQQAERVTAASNFIAVAWAVTSAHWSGT